ncbi:MAG: calcium-binding protein [Pseudomonadota bacterium]
MITILREDFESDGNSLTGGARYTTSAAEFVGGPNDDDYFTRTNGTIPAISGTYTGASGLFFAVADTNGSSVSLDTETLTFAAVDITGFTNLSVSGLFAEDTASDGLEDWDSNTLVYVQVSIDGGAFQRVLQFAATGGTNTAPGQDTDFDGTADAADLTDTFSSFSGDIAAIGTSMVIQIVFENVQAADEDIAIDTFQLTGNAPIQGTENNDNLMGTPDADSILGGAGVDFIASGDGNDIIDGQTGRDAVDAGAGDDTVFGNAERDILWGNSGMDVLFGGDDDDLLIGDDDADQLFGGDGIDTAFYAKDAVVNLADTSGNTGEAAGDTFESVENLRGADGGTYIFTGNGVSNTLIGADQDDQLFGGDDADTLIGNGGNDTMDGGAGGDRFIVDDAGDVLIEAAAGGYDRAIVSVSYTLGDNVEAANATGSGNIDITGNASDNWLNGNSGSNVLEGGEGNDRLQGGDSTDLLFGGTGNDNLYGQAGIDIFAFADGDGLDVIRDFEAGEIIDLSATSASRFDALTMFDLAIGAYVDYGTGQIVIADTETGELTEFNFAFS